MPQMSFSNPIPERSEWYRANQLINILLETGKITENQIPAIMLEKQNNPNQSIEEILIRMKTIEETDIPYILEDYYKVPYVNLSEIKFDEEVLRIFPEDVAKKYLAIPVKKKENEITVAMSSPNDITVLDNIQNITGYTVKPLIALESSISKAIEKAYSFKKNELKIQIFKQLLEDENIDSFDIKDIANTPLLVKLVDTLMYEAVRSKASDVHIEPQEKAVFIRFRIDGILHTIESLPKEIQPALTSRIKVMADMDITEKRTPQDGQMQINILDRTIDFRVSTLPAKYGEKIVIRVLDKSSFTFGIQYLGLLPEMQAKFEEMLNTTSGIILVAGPSGNGKTTTLYATVNKIKSSTKNIITLEDPIEYNLISENSSESGITQVQINAKINFTFANALRSCLRQDPDIILLGEIRDKETCEIAINAALIGRLILSTIHTNDAVSTITRILDMGIEPYLFVSSVTCILAQRLVRTLCIHCKVPYSPPKKVLENLNLKISSEEIKFYRHKGCERCGNTGYSGRTGIFELLIIDEAIRDLILEKTKSSILREVAKKNNMPNMKQNGIQLVAKGITTMAEIMRVLPADI